MFRVFISYSTKDIEMAKKVLSIIEDELNIRCWISFRDLLGGVIYSEEIESTINEAECVVLLYSKNASSSQHVKNELELAIDSHKNVIPCSVDLFELNGEFRYFLKNKNLIAIDEIETNDLQKNRFKSSIQSMLSKKYNKCLEETCDILSKISQFGVNDYLQDFINKFYTLSNETLEGKNDTYLQDLWNEFVREFKNLQVSSTPDFTNVISIMNKLLEYINDKI